MNRFIKLGIGVAAFAGLWGGAWYLAAGHIDAEIRSLGAASSTTTTSLDCDDLKVGGFPFWFDVDCRGVTIRDGDILVALPAVRATTLAYWPMQVLAVFTGPLSYSDAFFGTRQEVGWDKAEASVRLSNLHLARASVLIDKWRYDDLLVGTKELATADHVELHVVDGGGFDAKSDRVDLKIFIEALALGVPSAAIAEGTSQFDATLSKVPANVLNWSDPAIVSDWQAAGGRLTLHGFTGSDTDAHFSVNGDLGLDPDGRAEGNLMAESKGIVEQLGELVPENTLPLLGTYAEDGSLNQAYTIHEGLIFAGMVPLGVLPPLF